MVELLSVLSATLATALAAWLVPASIDIVSWTPAGPGRVAVFAPLYVLWIALGGAIAAAIILRIGRVRPDVVVPASLLWLWTLPFLPRLAEQWPLLLVLATPARWLIAGAAAAIMAVRAAPSGQATRWRLPGRSTAFAIALALYIFCGFRSLDTIGLTGDEPHYLVIAQSLLADHDLQIANTLTRGDYHAFFTDTLRPDYLQRGVNGAIYSIHAPGLAALVLPGYAAAGARGALVIVCLLAALASLAIFDTARTIGGPAAAWITWASVCLTVPFIPHAWSLYPEAAALAIVAWAIKWTVDGLASTPRLARPAVAWCVRGVVVAVLPWLHTKFSVLLAALTVWALADLRGRRRLSLAFLAPIAVSLAAWFAFFYVIYGRFDPLAPYGAYPNQFVALGNVPRSVLGLLFDQKFGLLLYAPVYAAAALGAWFALADSRWRPLALGSLATIALFVGASARFYMWWGGSSAPARFLVPLTPVAAPLIAIALAQPPRGWRALTAALGVMSVTIALTTMLGTDRRLLFSDPHGHSRLVDAFEASVPLDALMPTFTEEDWRTSLREWPARIRGAIPVEARREAVLRGEVAFVDAFDPRWRRAFDYATLSRLSPQAWLDRAHIEVDRGDFTVPLALPPGQYELRASVDESPFASKAAFRTLPIGMPETIAQLVDEETAREANRVDLIARSVQPASERPREKVRELDPITGHPDAFIAYTDDRAYPEGGVFWTRGTSDTTVFVVTAGAREMVLTLHVGPAGATVSLEVDGRGHTLTMSADETRSVSFPVTDRARYIAVRVGASRAFRPRDVHPQSSDLRSLGCQVRVEVR